MVEQILRSASQKVAFGAHHDSITGTSTAEVHQQEKELFASSEAVEWLTILSNSFFSLADGTPSDTEHSLMFYALNSNLHPRSEVVSLTLPSTLDDPAFASGL